MEKIELKKEFERQKAVIKIAMLMLALSAPTLVMNVPQRTPLVALFAIGAAIALLYRRLCRLNFKLSRLIR